MARRFYHELIRPRAANGFSIMEGLLWLGIASGFAYLVINTPVR